MTLAHPDLAAGPGPVPGTREHTTIVTASKVAAIVGLSPYASPWETWQVMKGRAPAQPTSEVHERGHILEPAVLAWWRNRHPDTAGVVEQPWFPIGDWAGARPDLTVDDDGHGNRAVVEAKTAANGDEWGQPGTDQIPPGYVCQVQWQMWAASATIAYVPMLGPRLAFAEYIVARDDELIGWLAAEALQFWESLTADQPPPLDYSRATIACLRRMHPDIDPDARVDVTDDQVAALAAARAAKHAADAAEQAALAPLLDALGRAKWADTTTRRGAAWRQASGKGVALKLAKETAE